MEVGEKGTWPEMMKIWVRTNGEKLTGFNTSGCVSPQSGATCTTGKNPVHSSARRTEISMGWGSVLLVVVGPILRWNLQHSRGHL